MNVLSADTQEKVQQSLINKGILTPEELVTLRQQAIDKHQPILGFLLEQRKVSDEQLTAALAEVNNVPYVNLSNVRIDAKILSLLPKDIAEHYMAVPIGEMKQRLVVAMLDADNIQAVDFLSEKIGRPLKVYAASESGIRHVIEEYEGSVADTGMESFLKSENGGDLIKPTEQDALSNLNSEAAKVQAEVADSPISKALNAILGYAAKNRASDVHVESLEKEIRIRCRVDGVLREVMKLPKSAEAPLVSRIKILANLKIDEHRIPQDGQFTIKIEGREVDLRVAVSPVVWGEQVILRLLDKSGSSMRLEDMGYTGRALRTILKTLKLPHGMILTSGPTGSGKSTSMYAMIQEIKNDSINIITLEDPVEYKIDGVNQIQVNPAVGLTFATGLRSVLRQDPDIIMVGEIRDKETANLAVQAALTGHLVFSTLHTNSAAGILPRLLDMGVEPFLIASTVRTVIGQRLVRRVSGNGEAYQSNAVETTAIHQTLGKLLPKTKTDVVKVGQDLGYQNLPLANQSSYTLVKGAETTENPTGFSGRMGLYESFEVTEQIQDLILKHMPSSAIQKQAIAQGMITMREDGYLKALSGLTTLQEVNRVASIDS